MTKLTTKELREEYVLKLKTERFEVGIVGFGMFGAIAYMVFKFAPNWWKLFGVIPLILMAFLIKRIKEIGEQIRENQK